MEHVQKVLQKMDASLKNLETDLQNSKVPQGEHDQFYAVMSVSFFYKKYSKLFFLTLYTAFCERRSQTVRSASKYVQADAIALFGIG